MEHPQFIIDYLAAACYETIEDWARDSDYMERDGGWVDEEGNPVDLQEQLLGALEGSDFHA